jgi:hypothetical protein
VSFEPRRQPFAFGRDVPELEQARYQDPDLGKTPENRPAVMRAVRLLPLPPIEEIALSWADHETVGPARQRPAAPRSPACVLYRH